MDPAKLSLIELDDRPELTATIGGREYHFGELPLEQLARLDAFLRRTVPHPVQAIRPHLAGLPDADRQALLENARREARSWPPQAGTSAGMAAILSTEPGQLEALEAGLAVHHPGLSRADAARVYRQLQRDAMREAARRRRAGLADDGEGLVKRIFSVIFGYGDPALEDAEEPLPEG